MLTFFSIRHLCLQSTSQKHSCYIEKNVLMAFVLPSRLVPSHNIFAKVNFKFLPKEPSENCQRCLLLFGSSAKSGHTGRHTTPSLLGVPLLSRVTKQWQNIGFQGEDPKTDFRGMGILGLDNLL